MGISCEQELCFTAFLKKENLHEVRHFLLSKLTKWDNSDRPNFLPHATKVPPSSCCHFHNTTHPSCKFHASHKSGIKWKDPVSIKSLCCNIPFQSVNLEPTLYTPPPPPGIPQYAAHLLAFPIQPPTHLSKHGQTKTEI